MTNKVVFEFKAETMHGESFPERRVVGVEAVLDEMERRNSRRFTKKDRAEMRQWLIAEFVKAA